VGWPWSVRKELVFVSDSLTETHVLGRREETGEREMQATQTQQSLPSVQEGRGLFFIFPMMVLCLGLSFGLGFCFVLFFNWI